MEVIKYAAVIISGYLLGSVSASILLSRSAWGGDVRSKGSGNAGATNMLVNTFFSPLMASVPTQAKGTGISSK